jgi:hypothetical protein
MHHDREHVCVATRCRQIRQPQRADRDDRHDQRHFAALAAGTRRAEDREAEHRERDG